MAVTPLKLSGSTNGRGIKLATAAAGTAVHTTATATGASKFDEIYIWAANVVSASKQVTVYVGATGLTGDKVIDTIPPKSGLYQLLPGMRLNGGVSVKAFAASPCAVTVFGLVNRNA